MLTDAHLTQIMPNLSQAKLRLYLPHLNTAMQAYGVDAPLRIAAFVAQLAHESGEFRWMEEIWGPTSAQRRYEPQCELARKLGNSQPGDGKRFKGRGPIQITGRSNYERYGGLLGLDLTADPDSAATPEIAFATAGLYWKTNGLNELADAQKFVTITRRINGGTNGLADRQKYYERACKMLGVASALPRDSAATRGAEEPFVAPLPRGHEAIVEEGAEDPQAPAEAMRRDASAPRGASSGSAAKRSANPAGQRATPTGAPKAAPTGKKSAPPR